MPGGRPRIRRPAFSPRIRILLAMVHIGEPAPDFRLPDQNGTVVELDGFRGRWVLLWWYPKAATPG
jgi:hypothetical protein